MNDQSPLIPQGSFLEQKNKGRARVRVAVFVVLAIHGIGLLALLMQGCKKEETTVPPSGEQTNTNPAPAFVEPTNPAPSVTSTSAPPVETPMPPTPPPAPATEYKVAAGDTFSSIAKKFHVTTQGIVDANPTVDPKKLQIGQTIKIPAATAPATNGAAAATPAPGNGQTYTVKSGDTLTSIAAQFGVSVRSLRTANNLTTDRIRVGQQLKIPSKAAVPAPAPSGATSAPSGTPSTP